MDHGRLQTYALSICFLALLCGSIAAGLFLINVVKVLVPDSTINPHLLAKYKSNERLRKYNTDHSAVAQSALTNIPPIAQPMGFAEGDTVITSQQPLHFSDKEIEVIRLKQLEALYSNHKFLAIQRIIFNVIIMLIGSIIFVIHWCMMKKISNINT